jgi:predicted porin
MKQVFARSTIPSAIRSAVVSAALSATLLAGPAMAQSSITIYGTVDAFGQSLHGAARQGRLQSGGLSGSRLGFRGTEDLGGGLRAFFVLESGLNLDDGSIGQGGTFYGRQALIGLTTAYGQISLGRQYSSLYTATSDFSIFSNSPAGPSTALIGGFGSGYEPVRGASNAASPPAAGATGNSGPARVNNSLRYETPAWRGFSASALYGAGEVAGAANDARLFDLGLRYTAAGFDVLFSYLDDKAVGTTAAQRTDAATATLAATYAWQPLRLAAGYLEFNDKRGANQDGRGYWIGADYSMGRQLLKAQYVENKPKFGNDNKSTAFGAGWTYALSKRTALYSSLTRFDNDAQAGSGGLGRFNGAIPAGVTSVGDNNITELALGIRHSF